jgi:hypothetical protein
VREKLTEKWSPQQIARYLAREYANDVTMRACPETMYRALFAGLLGRREAKLRIGRARRKKQRRGVPTLNKIKNMTLIHEGPIEVNDRTVPGHWEGDLIIGRGQGSAIGTLVERATRYVHLIHLPQGWKARQVRNALITQTAHIPPQLRRTLTWDQGRELTLHKDIEARTGFRIYFCDLHSPWSLPGELHPTRPEPGQPARRPSRHPRHSSHPRQPSRPRCHLSRQSSTVASSSRVTPLTAPDPTDSPLQRPSAALAEDVIDSSSLRLGHASFAQGDAQRVRQGAVMDVDNSLDEGRELLQAGTGAAP